MDKLKIQGGTRLEGIVPIQGAKNAALPAMAATLLTGEPVELQNLPLVNDIQTTRKLLEELGVDVEVSSDRSATLSAAALDSCEARYELVKTMRASVLVLGPTAGPVRSSARFASGWLCHRSPTDRSPHPGFPETRG